MSDEFDRQPDTMRRIAALLAHLSNIVWIADRDAAPEELIEHIRVEAAEAKRLGLRKPGGREEGKRAARRRGRCAARSA